MSAISAWSRSPIGVLTSMLSSSVQASAGSSTRVFRDGFYSDRTDFIRTAIRNQLERHTDVVRQSVTRKSLELGLRVFTRRDLEQVRSAGEQLDINVLGLATIAEDVTGELALATIASVTVLGALHASQAVRQALAGRIH